MQFTSPLILVVDTDAAKLAVLEEFLCREGYATSTAQTARAAYQLIQMEHPNLLLVNVDLDWYEAGLDLISLLRQQPRTAGLPVILCTADVPALRMHLSELRTWNCQVLETPFTEEALLWVVQVALESGLQSRALGE